MSTDIHWHDGDTITARCLPADRNGPALNVIKLNPGTRWEVTIFPDLEFAKAMRAALDALYPLPGESDDALAERYADEHASEFEASAPPLHPAMSEAAQLIFDTANAMNSAYLAGMRAEGAQ